ncbi:YcgN family cysteine cluster protein [Alteromonas sediminis]|uniref:YcgN family cysteine cluster protein n=1 Tax=Alteromonas sediminis TaxID=2259342 RepID=A0A3N5Z4P6_9ALTE|nr:YcgN family cysteine cluster protein [Alteromonas sediminis]RPJ65084.1 YcgN family cysteine cluster protein [Alteromonas sediminis]
MPLEKAFWEKKSLQDMNTEEWEALCDGCAKCCLHKFIDDDESEEAKPTDVINAGETIVYTNISCHLLNTKSCECTAYQTRTALVPDCVKLTKDNLKDIFFMPPSCAYRLLYEGKALPDWHPLLNKGKKAAMHKAGQSVRNKTISENDVDLESFEHFIVTWPLDTP